MVFEKIGKLMNVGGASASFKKSAEAAWICDIFRSTLMAQALELNQNIKELSFKDGTIRIKIDNSCAAAELEQSSVNLIAIVNKALKKEIVQRISYRIG